MSPLPGERDPAVVQAERTTPGRRAAERATFGDDHSRRSTAVDALKTVAWDDTEPRPGYPYTGRTQAQEEEAVLRSVGEAGLRREIDDDDLDEHDLPDLLDGEELLDGRDFEEPVYEQDLPSLLDDEAGVVYVDAETGELLDPADLDDYVVDDGYDLPPAA